MAGEDTADGSYSWSFDQDSASWAPRESSRGDRSKSTRADESQRSPQATSLGALDSLFDIQEVIGHGGMGIVYRAKDALGRDLALKVISGRLSGQHRERFRREGELTASLDHPGIVKIHSGGELEGVPYLAYELIRGGHTFGQARQDLSQAAQVRLLHEVAQALGHAHGHGIVHRDVKPDNILVDDAGRPHLADFGLAWTSTAETLTKTGALVGTPTYMAPEQFFGARHESWGPQTDVWALGVMLYELLTDRLPFEATSLLELGAMVRHGQVLACREHAPAVSAGLEAVCLKALERDPALRYSDADAFARDLGAALGARRVSALRDRLGTRRRRRLAVVTSCVVLALGIAAAIGFVKRPRPPTASDLVRATGAFEAGTLGRAGLEATLRRTPSAKSRPERRSAHLALARDAATEAASWRDRLDHALQVLELDPDPEQRTRAETLVGEAHAALGERALAARAFERALARSDDLRLLARTAKALLEAGEAQTAKRYAARVVERHLSRDGLELLFATQAATRDWSGAQATLKRLAPGSKTEVLRAQLAFARDREPLSILRTAARSWPRDPRPLLVLVRMQWLEMNAPAAALQSAELGLEAGQRDPRLVALARTLRTLLSDAPAPSLIDTSLREDAGRWLLLEARRELAIAGRLRDRRRDVPAKAPGAKEREARAAKTLARALKIAPPDSPGERQIHLALAELEGPESPHLDRAGEAARADPLGARLLASRSLGRRDPARALEVLGDDRSREALLLRGQALLALDRARDAAPYLREAAGPRQNWAPACHSLASALDALGRTEEARATRARAQLLESPRRSAAKDALTELRDGALIRNGSYEEVEEFLERRVFALDPLNSEGVLILGMKGFITRKAAGVKEMGRAALLSSTLPRRLTSAMFALSSNTHSLVGRSRVLEALDAPFDPLSADDALQFFHALLTAWAVEFEGQRDLLDAGSWELSVCLRRDPAAGAARVMRGFLMLRAGQFEQAKLDLLIAQEQTPFCPSVSFYQTLLDAARRAPLDVVLEGLNRTHRLKYKVWRESGWGPSLYPELRDYPKRSALEPFWKRLL